MNDINHRRDRIASHIRKRMKGNVYFWICKSLHGDVFQVSFEIVHMVMKNNIF